MLWRILRSRPGMLIASMAFSYWLRRRAEKRRVREAPGF